MTRQRDRRCRGGGGAFAHAGFVGEGAIRQGQRCQGLSETFFLRHRQVQVVVGAPGEETAIRRACRSAARAMVATIRGAVGFNEVGKAVLV